MHKARYGPQRGGHRGIGREVRDMSGEAEAAADGRGRVPRRELV